MSKNPANFFSMPEINYDYDKNLLSFIEIAKRGSVKSIKELANAVNTIDKSMRS